FHSSRFTPSRFILTFHSSRFTLTFHSLVEARHRPLHSFSQNNLDRIGGRIERLVQHGLFALRYPRQHKRCEILDRMIRLNAKPYASELVRSKPRDDRLQPVVSAGASARPDANHSERQRCFVTRNDHICGVALTVTIEKRP